MHFLTILDIKVDLIRFLSLVFRPLVNIGEVLGYFRLDHLSILERLRFAKFVLSLYLSHYQYQLDIAT